MQTRKKSDKKRPIFKSITRRNCEKDHRFGWMRQAGRSVPEFIALRDQYDFFTRCQTPELAAEITVQPIRRFPLDAAILFSDILVVPQAMGIDFKMKESVGRWLDTPIRTLEQVQNLPVEGAEENLKICL